MDKQDFLKNIPGGNGSAVKYYSLPELAQAEGADLERLPVCLRVVLESLLRNMDGKAVAPEHVKALLGWQPQAKRTAEIPFRVARVVLQDFTGVPLLVDLAAMRDAAKDWDAAGNVEPLVPVDLVVDHSVQVDNYGSKEALRLNLKREFERNEERYRFLKWGMGAFKSFKVVPPGVGIVHQVNLEHLAPGLANDAADPSLYYPDTLVGTDSHTTMINGIGVVGWGVGGIEAEAAMLGQPVYILTPDVVGVHLKGQLREGRTATDLVLTVVELLRQTNVVGKFVEFFGEGAASLSVPDRATISNMAPEYGATIGYFAADDKTMEYFSSTGRSAEVIDRYRSYLQEQGMYGIHPGGKVEYTQVVELDLDSVAPSVAGPKRPQDRIPLPQLKDSFAKLLAKEVPDGGYGRSAEQTAARHATELDGIDVGDGDVLIAAITSCTNTSNPAVLIAAGLLARKAAALGLKVHPRVKTSLAPGSRVVTDYLAKTGLDKDLEALGFYTVGYGCTTCIGNSGPLAPEIEKPLLDEGVVAASVLSGNRNFEARVHPNIRANFLMSPPLVVAFALAGTVNIDLEAEPLATVDGKAVHLKDIWPSDAEIQEQLAQANDPQFFRKRYANYEDEVPMWSEIESEASVNYGWDQASTYIRKPPFLQLDNLDGAISGARALAILGDSVTTDHISPAGAIGEATPAGSYLKENQVRLFDFNSYGSRRGNHEVMMRGTFANVRIRNLMAPGTEGGVTIHQPSGEQMSIYAAAERYREEGVPLLMFAGEEYGSGSSRDWAAKGTRLLGIHAVIASSFERIHRSNLVGMGVLPLVFAGNDSVASLGLTGAETFAIDGLGAAIIPQQEATLRISYPDGSSKEALLTVRVDTPNEAECFASGGILKHVLKRLVGPAAS